MGLIDGISNIEMEQYDQEDDEVYYTLGARRAPPSEYLGRDTSSPGVAPLGESPDDTVPAEVEVLAPNQSDVLPSPGSSNNTLLLLALAALLIYGTME